MRVNTFYFALVVLLYFYSNSNLILCNISLQSNDIREGHNINNKFTPQGNDISPAFLVSGISPKSKSLAFVLNDPDAPNGLFTHWAVVNISTALTIIEAGAVPGEEITNSWGEKKYKGPSPPYHQRHRYVFTIYELDIEHKIGRAHV